MNRPPLDIFALAKEHAGKNCELHAEHINPANVKTLKTIGFDRCYTRTEEPYLKIKTAVVSTSTAFVFSK